MVLGRTLTSPAYLLGSFVGMLPCLRLSRDSVLDTLAGPSEAKPFPNDLIQFDSPKQWLENVELLTIPLLLISWFLEQLLAVVRPGGMVPLSLALVISLGFSIAVFTHFS